MHYSHAWPSVLEAVPRVGTVLVIDDDAWIRTLIAEFLADEGYEVAQASDGATGLQLAEALEPDVVLLDLALPIRSGLDVLHHLKQQPATSRIPVVVVSAYATLLVRDENAQPDGLVEKPFDLTELLDQVNRLVRAAHPKFRLLPPTRATARSRA